MFDTNQYKLGIPVEFEFGIVSWEFGLSFTLKNTSQSSSEVKGNVTL